jgi:hypothetical protein
MSAFTTRDFASLLDEAMQRARDEAAPAARPAIPLDVRAAVPDELLGASDPHAAAEYIFAATAALGFGAEPETEPHASPLPPPVEPDSIAAELGLTGRESGEELDRIRREFAFASHPDRVAPDLRERAAIRMKIANGMIDEAKKRLRRA